MDNTTPGHLNFVDQRELCNSNLKANGFRHADQSAPFRRGFCHQLFRILGIRLLGVVLIVAALLKLAAFVTGPPLALFHYPLWFVIVGIQCELFFGVLLLLRPRSKIVRIAAIGLFGFLFVMATRTAMAGVPDCNCLGNVSIHPCWMMLFDLTAICTLASSLIRRAENTCTSAATQAEIIPRVRLTQIATDGAGVVVCRFSPSRFYGFAAGILCGSMSLGMVVWGTTSLFPTLDHHFASLLQPPAHFVAARFDFGTAYAGETRRLELKIENPGSVPITLLAGYASCTCVVLDSLPLTIPPGQTATLHVRLRLAERNIGRFEQKLLLYTDNQMQFTLTNTICGIVRPVHRGESDSEIQPSQSTAAF